MNAGVILVALRHSSGDNLPIVPSAPSGVCFTIAKTVQEKLKPQAGAVDFRMRIVNRSNHDITYMRADFWSNHAVFLKGPDGKELPLTAFGKSVRRDLIEHNAPRDHQREIHLIPRSATEDYVRLDFKRLYDPQPGSYSLVVKYVEQFGFPMGMTSNALKIELPGKSEPGNP